MGRRSVTGQPSPLPVCFLVDRLHRGGTELFLLRLIAGLDRSRFAPALVLVGGLTADGGGARSLSPRCPVLRLGVRGPVDLRVLRALPRLGIFLRRHGAGVLQLHHPTPTAIGLAGSVLAPDVRLVRTRFNLGYWLTPAGRRLERLATRRCDVTVVNCEAAASALLAEGPPPRGDVEVIPTGVETRRLAALPELELRPTDRRRRVLLLANLRPVKQPEAFVRAAALLAPQGPGTTFEIAGDGESRSSVEAEARRLGLGERLRLLGEVGNTEDLLAETDVAVLCSRSEGLPNALLEYMAAARPIVATAVGGVPEAVRDGVEALLVAPGDDRALAAAIGRLLDDRALARRLGNAARTRCLATYPMEATIERYSRLYERLAGHDRVEPRVESEDFANDAVDGSRA